MLATLSPVALLTPPTTAAAPPSTYPSLPATATPATTAAPPPPSSSTPPQRPLAVGQPEAPDGWACFPDSRPVAEVAEAAAQAAIAPGGAVATASAAAAATAAAAAGGDATGQATHPHHIAVGRQFLTSKELRLAVEKSLMVNGRGLVCKKVSEPR